jgi:hypothetical protein
MASKEKIKSLFPLVVKLMKSNSSDDLKEKLAPEECQSMMNEMLLTVVSSNSLLSNHQNVFSECPKLSRACRNCCVLFQRSGRE